VAETHHGAVRPRPLGAVAAARLVRSRVPDAAPEFCAAAHAVTGGNPFHLHALVTSAAADGLPSPAELADFGPETIARSIARQLARLPDGAADLARAVAVLGADATMREVAGLAGIDVGDAARVSDRLRTAGLLAPGSRLDFAHPIQRAAVTAALGPAERALWHARAADLLRTAGADPERVGLQLLQAEPGGDARAVDVLRAAAQAASTRGAPESATAYLRRALAEPPDAAARPHVELELGLALAARRHPDAPALLHAAIAGLPAGPVRGEAGLRAARAVALAALYADVVALCRATLAQPAGIAPETIARLEAELDGMAMTRAGTLQEVRERPRRESTAVPLWRITAAALAGFAGHPARESMALVRPVLPAEVLAAERESLVATVVLTLVLLWNDELEAATMVADRQLAAARPRGWASALANGSFLRAEALLRRGEVAEAEADARDAFAFKRTVSPPDSLAWTLVPLVDVLRERDDLDGAERALGAGSVEALTPDLLVFPLVRQARARLRLAQGRPREALADVRAAAAGWTELGITGPGMSSWRLWAAEALMALGEQEEAAVLAAEQLRLAERLGAAGPCGAALRAVARCGPRADAPATLARAVERLEGSAAGLERMHALCDLGAALRRSGHREAAREPLRHALALADRGGALRLAARAQAELRFAGARPRRAALAGRDALTPAERRVAALAAEGRTNRQIAQALFVTLRTVETHLTHAFAKLGVGSREGLPAALWPAGTSAERERTAVAS
jgi:DNA-binding CsgD family transcriptional regulator